MQTYVLVLLALLANGVVGLAGALLPERWVRRRPASLSSFAAGALLAAAFVDLLPESIERAGTGAVHWAFVGLASFAVLEWALGHRHAAGASTPRTLPASLLIADGLHNVGDGAAVAAAFVVSPHAGLVATLAVVAHELPQEVGDYALLRAAGVSRGRSLAALALVQLTAFAGAAGVLLASEAVEGTSAAVLGFAAGTFLYIGGTDLLPALHAGSGPRDRASRLLGLLAGAGVLVLVSALAHR